MDIACITIDCAEPAVVAQFWNDALHWGGVTVGPDPSTAICGPPSGEFYLEFVRVPDRKVVKNRLHLGCAAGTLEQLEHELTRLHSLAASIAWEEEFPAEVASSYRNVVLRDVEGNEFCLSGGSIPN